jgi:PAS domain-containing protein
VSQLHDLPGRLPALLQTLQRRLLRASRLRLAVARRKPRSAPPAHDLPAEFDRFVRIGERLERGLEELKDIQWQIRENEARYRDLLDNQADVILRRDAQGRLTFVNRAFCGVFGLEREEVLGRPSGLGRRCRGAADAGRRATPAALRAGNRHGGGSTLV